MECDCIVNMCVKTKRSLFLMTAIVTLLFTGESRARDEVQEFPISAPMASSTAKEKLTSEVKFYFGETEFGLVQQSFGEYRTNKKTNAFGKSDAEACSWVFLSALIQLHDRAVSMGGNAVIRIRSNYRNSESSSTATFRCGAGNVIAGVALIGEIVILGNRPR